MCGQVPPRPDKVYCESCAKQSAMYTARNRAIWRQKGLCLSCGKTPPASNRTMCDKCLTSKREYEAHKRKNSPAGHILERDGFKCRICGGDGSRLIVHHIDGTGRKEGRRNVTSNDTPSNLVTLCDSCHYRIHKLVRFSLDLDYTLSLIEALRTR